LVEEYGGIREEDIDLMHDARPESHFDLTIDLAERIVKIAEDKSRELQNLIDYIIYPHSHEEIMIYAMALKHRLEEK
jgi:hypothetical protein